jgi:hypothetical protein
MPEGIQPIVGNLEGREGQRRVEGGAAQEGTRQEPREREGGPQRESRGGGVM